MCLRPVILFVSLLILASPFLAATAENQEATCRKGLYKCAARQQDAAEYWSCMRYECKAEDAHTAQPDCPDSVEICMQPLTAYNQCIDMTCGGIPCEEGTNRCAPALSAYYQCTMETCMGLLKSSYSALEARAKEEDDLYRALARQAPGNTPQSPLFRGPTVGGVPLRFLVCPGGGQKYCHGDDSRSCTCMDGRTPINVLETPYKGPGTGGVTLQPPASHR